MKRHFCAIAGILLSIVLTACARNGMPAGSPIPGTIPIPTATVIPAPEAAPAQTKETAEPEAIPEPTIGDIPAYVQAGLPARDKMTDVERWYYYGEALPGADYVKSQTDFKGEATADFDGDGQAETAKIVPGKLLPDHNKQYQTVTVEIERVKLELFAGEEGGFDLSGKVLDIDKADGKKEIEVNTAQSAFVLAYDQDTLRIIRDGYADANGTGYIMAWEFKKITPERHVFFPSVWKLGKDRMDFERVPMRYYTQRPDLTKQGAAAQWDQPISKDPGGKAEILLKMGTVFQLGLFDGARWMQIVDGQGNQLGWLDGAITNIDQYSGGYYQIEGMTAPATRLGKGVGGRPKTASPTRHGG